MSEPDHEKLRRELESAASEARDGSGARRLVTGRTVLIGMLVAVPVATAVLVTISSAGEDAPAERAGSSDTAPPGALSTDAVMPAPSRRPGPPPPATSTGPDLPPHPEPPPDADRPVTHTVQPGETLARIALRYEVPLEQIAEQNALADPDRIRAGQNLVIHPAPPGEVVIAPGSTLGEYAERHGTTVARLMALNPQIADPDHIVAGARLRVA